MPMAGRSVGHLSLPGWLWLMAAISYLDEPGEDHEALLASCPFRVALVDLVEGRFLLMTPSLVEMLGRPPATPAQLVDPSVMVDDPGHLAPMSALMTSGAMDLYGVTRRIRRPGREALEAETWTVVSDVEHRRRALWLVTPVVEEAAAWEPPHLEVGWPDQAAGLVMGSFDDEWRIARISADVQAVLGYPAEELIGRQVIDLVHPEDLPGLFASVAAALASHGGVSTRRRLLHRSGEWVEVRGVITPIPDDRLRLGFAFSAAWAHRDAPPSSSAARTTVLERHMWRIASEVAASGLAAGFQDAPLPEGVPGLEELSPRQWEVLTRLLQGERVPAIAGQLFISQSTVRNHLTDIFRKVGVRSQQELLGLLRPSAGPEGP